MMVNLHCQFNWINKCLGHQLATPLGVTMRVFPEKINCKNWSWVWGVEEVLSECCCWLNSGHVLLTQKPPCQGPQYFRLIEMSKPSLGKAQRNGKTFPWSKKKKKRLKNWPFAKSNICRKYDHSFLLPNVTGWNHSPRETSYWDELTLTPPLAVYNKPTSLFSCM